MLNDEEKKVLEILKEFLEKLEKFDFDCQECGFNQHYEGRSLKIMFNLIEKQSKEIEENKKYLVNLTHEQYIKLVEQIRSEISKEWADKIKAKIEEVKDGTFDAKIVLQSLLEKGVDIWNL